MLRRLLLTLCLLLTLASAVAWSLTYHRGCYVAGYTVTDGFAITAERGWLELWAYVHKSRHRWSVEWSAGRSYDAMRDAHWWGASDEGSGRTIFARVPLLLLTLAFALLAVWLWRRGRRLDKGKGFEVVTGEMGDGAK